MDLVDELMDVANKACEDIFAKPSVVYTSPSGATVTIPGDFQRVAKAVGLDLTEHSSWDPRLDCRVQSLRDLGVDPVQQGTIDVEVEGTVERYTIIDIQPGGPGTVVYVLGRVRAATS